MSEEKKSRGCFRCGCLWIVVILGALITLLAASILFGLLSGGGAGAGSAKEFDAGVDDFPELSEVWASGQGTTKVVVVPIRGFLSLEKEESLWESTPGSGYAALQAIHRATLDEEVKGIILDVDSGGGGITASDVIYQALLDFKEAQEGRCVVAILGDVAASGAYYIALSADYIVARPTTITGSIGVIVHSFNVRQLAEKLGVKDVTLKSGENKDLLNPMGELTAEQQQMMQGIVDELHQRFIGLVSSNRPSITPQAMEEISRSGVFTARRALELGLVDSLGYWKDAQQNMATMLEVDDVKVYRYEEPFSFSSFLRVQSRWSPLTSLMRALPETRFLYRWPY